ncbi:MAG: hypothetical protein ACRDH0_05070 [Actinomycetota bacterium]
MYLVASERKRAEAELSRAEARYRTLVEQIPAMTYIEPPSLGDLKATRIVYLSPRPSACWDRPHGGRGDLRELEGRYRAVLERLRAGSVGD